MYNFDKIVDRRNTNSIKWDTNQNALPMWIADMDFEVCPDIVEALQKRLDNHIYGYSYIPDEWYDAYINWWNEYHHFKMNKEWLMFSLGVVPSISSIVRRLTLPGENVLLQTPVYNIFFNSVLNNGRNVIENKLLYKDGVYSIDFQDLEEKLANPQTSMMILCNPHNPIGKIWDYDTLKQIGDLCAKHHVIVVSDEIHCEITRMKKEYIPFQSVSDNCLNNSITCISPTKTFNIAGLHTSAISIPNPVLRHKVWRGINNDEIAEPNIFSVTGAVAAYTKGRAWLDEFRKYIDENIDFTKNYLNKNLPMLRLVETDATYLLWIDCSSITDNSVEFTQFLLKETGLYLSDGLEYGEGGKTFVRMNIACPREYLKKGLTLLHQGINILITKKTNQ